jgi:eukaryotic-like serine/threonine-protein kinase
MDPERWAVIEPLYHGALEQKPAVRSAWLRNACAGDAALEEELESLLACASADLSNPAARSGMARLWNEIAAATDSSAHTHAEHGVKAPLPSHIGQYRILRLLGEGGMGAVYEAGQDHPQRIVALKVIRSGLSDPSLVRRFEVELLALGRLQHPGIAQIYEAGTADYGSGPQPYFAMEFVRGRPLLEYAEAHRLDARQRLDLIARICDAVHHAHQRGIIHRDLKPANILVDETGQPKVLDFGVARATDSDVRMTAQTGVGQIIGTLAYMSPEQVLADPLELDTRSDVYALGVVLYEMLAQRLPYKISSRQHEAVRAIQKDEPAPLSSVSSIYRGDIETIVAKALEKDKTRRYASAAELATDIRRYLHDQPIAARPASTLYQLQKFARRHRALVFAAAAILVVLIAGVIVSAREAARAGKEAATSRAISDFLQNDLLAQASAANQARPNNKPDPDLKVRTALDRAAAKIGGRFDRQPEVEAALRVTIGQTYTDLGLYPQAHAQLGQALKLERDVQGPDNPKTLETTNRLARVIYLQGQYSQAESLLRPALETEQRVLGRENSETLIAMNGLANAYRAQGKYPQADALYNQSLEIRRRVLGPEHPDTLVSMNNLAVSYEQQGQYAKAETLDSRLVEIRRRVLGLEHPNTLASMNNLAVDYEQQAQYAKAEVLDRQLLDIRRRVFGPDHPETLASMANLALICTNQGKFAQAEALDSQTLSLQTRVIGPEHPATVKTMSALGFVEFAQGKYAQAVAELGKAVELERRIRGPEHPNTLGSMTDLAGAYAAQGNYDQADRLYTQVLASYHRSLPAQAPAILYTLSGVAFMRQLQGRYAEAETYAAQALAGQEHILGAENPLTMLAEEDLALALVSQRKFAEAEPLAREAADFARKTVPNDWDRFRAESLLGASLAGQKKYAEAEPLLTGGYNGMAAQKDFEPVPGWYHLDRAADWIVQMYDAWDKPAKAAGWKKLARHNSKSGL